MALNDSTDITTLRKFDLDLEFGKQWETTIDELFTGKKTIEVKTERDKWASTGNICIEVECYKKPSGINSTEADVWVHNLVNNGRHIASLVLPTPVLKEVLSNVSSRTVMGGDNNASKLVLISLCELLNSLKQVKG